MENTNGMALAVEKGNMVLNNGKSSQLSVFSDPKSFEVALKMAETLAKSTVVPKEYQGTEGNCLIAIEMASRINTSPMMVMQNLYIVNGRPAWSSQWIIAMINSSHRYKTELQFNFGEDKEDGGLSCYAYAEDYAGHTVKGPKITMKMAEAEGWVNKNGSKWKTMPKVMIQYRAASFFGRMNCPDMIMGIYSQEEAVEMDPVKEAAAVIDPVTGTETPITIEGEPIITDEQRRSLFAMAKDNLGKEWGNEAIKALLKEFGYESTTKLPVSVYEKILERLAEICANTAAAASQNAEDTKG